ncbi:probable E3 ubiquitin-protein ligase RHB1A [Andrographis paniculata]|uniref:probable E3 ubiquitin-protein ligase RHB1A n=1 Tax=Andrographis paniculata TaxID=175694 RepID=UPI0021E92BBB|nr:probable E3 ubiquitin-protein ligase RHB1A [Andrographis paniculata]XP_051132526.1 probable E3 ubiquitin-protein ligase RHB1A [Andrographis paniculata]
MGGCCSSSRKLPLHGTPTYYYHYSPYSEDHESLTSHDGVTTILTSGMLFDLNLDMSIPDTYRSPPAPLPYDAVLGHQKSTEIGSHVDPKEANCKTTFGLPLSSPMKVDTKLLQHKSDTLVTDEEDTCPTCLEEYDVENPKIMTKCNHHFHLSCILEWMELSDTCPICDQEMVYEVL